MCRAASVAIANDGDFGDAAVVDRGHDFAVWLAGSIQLHDVLVEKVNVAPALLIFLNGERGHSRPCLCGVSRIGELAFNDDHNALERLENDFVQKGFVVV